MLGFRPLASDPLAAGARAVAAAPPPLPDEQPPSQSQPAGAAYTPRRREGPPRRISFLEQDIREKYERARELETLIKATEGRARETEAQDIERRDLAAIRALSRNTEQLEAIRASIDVLELELQQLIAIQQDEDDAIAVILMAATLH